MTDISKIDVIQINLNKVFNAGIGLLGKINKVKCFLALIQEPYCYKGTFAADSTLTKTPEEALQELASVHFPSHKPIATKEYNKIKIPTKEINDSCHTWMTNTKVKNCLLQFKSKKAAGPASSTCHITTLKY